MTAKQKRLRYGIAMVVISVILGLALLWVEVFTGDLGKRVEDAWMATVSALAIVGLFLTMSGADL